MTLNLSGAISAKIIGTAILATRMVDTFKLSEGNALTAVTKTSSLKNIRISFDKSQKFGDVKFKKPFG